MRALAALNPYLYKYRLKLFLGVIFIILSNLFAVYAPQIIREAVDTITEISLEIYEADGVVSDALKDRIVKIGLYLALLYVFVAVMKGFFLFLTRQTIIIVSRYIEYDLKNSIYQHLQSLSLGFFKANNTGDLMNRMNEDVSKVRMYLGPAIMYSANLVVLFIMAIIFMLMVNVELTLYVLAPLPVMSVCVYFVSHQINVKSEAVQRQQGELSTFAQEDFSGIRVIKAFNQSQERQRKFDEGCQTFMNKTLSLVTVDALFMPIITLLIGLSTIITIYVGGVKVINGEDGLTVGNIAEFVIYINMLTWPFAAVGWVTSLVQRAAASQQRINELLDTKPEITFPTENKIIPTGKITFENVSFTFKNSGIKALKNVSFTLNPGETLGVIGRTGAGKSTLIHMAARQFDPDSGRVLVDGVDIKSVNLDEVHEKIGYVPQEVFLFSETIQDNIAFGLMPNEVSTELIEQSAKDAHIHHNISEFKLGYDTVLGERGINLSGGQKQRISIARAIVKNPSILLLDDCLSAVDAETEEIILGNLQRIMKNKTALIVSHRISAVKNADKILFMEHGEVVEQGTHKELVAQKGGYYQLYLKQLKEQENVSA
ncbi:MAG: ABC transporter ATP-binding protein [Luteibaculaceae bacterium]